MGKWHWGKAARETAAEIEVKYKKFEAILTSPTASCLDLGKGIYSYREGGLFVIAHLKKRVILSAGIDMSADALDGWYVSNRALRQCRELKVTPGNVIASMEDADAFPAQNGRTLYRGLFDVLVHERKNRIVSVGTPKSLNHTILRQAVPRGSGGTPVGSMPRDINDLLARARRAGFVVSKAGSGHNIIGESETPEAGRSVVIPSTGSNWRGMMNNIMKIRSALGVDLRRF
jgi:hypothetical protein